MFYKNNNFPSQQTHTITLSTYRINRQEHWSYNIVFSSGDSYMARFCVLCHKIWLTRILQYRQPVVFAYQFFYHCIKDVNLYHIRNRRDHFITNEEKALYIIALFDVFHLNITAWFIYNFLYLPYKGWQSALFTPQSPYSCIERIKPYL